METTSPQLNPARIKAQSLSTITLAGFPWERLTGMLGLMDMLALTAVVLMATALTAMQDLTEFLTDIRVLKIVWVLRTATVPPLTDTVQLTDTGSSLAMTRWTLTEWTVAKDPHWIEITPVITGTLSTTEGRTDGRGMQEVGVVVVHLLPQHRDKEHKEDKGSTTTTYLVVVQGQHRRVESKVKELHLAEERLETR